MNLTNLALQTAYNKRPNLTHIRTRNICVRKSRARVFESGVRNTRVRSSYTRTGYRGGQCKGFLIIRYTTIKISRELLSRLLCGIFS